MLVLSRKTQQEIMIGDNIRITILQVRGQTVRVGIEAPREVRVARSEVSNSPAANSPIANNVDHRVAGNQTADECWTGPVPVAEAATDVETDSVASELYVFSTTAARATASRDAAPRNMPVSQARQPFHPSQTSVLPNSKEPSVAKGTVWHDRRGLRSDTSVERRVERRASGALASLVAGRRR